MVSLLDPRSTAGSSSGLGQCVVFLGKTLYSNSASLHPGVLMGSGKLLARGNLKECWGITYNGLASHPVACKNALRHCGMSGEATRDKPVSKGCVKQSMPTRDLA